MKKRISFILLMILAAAPSYTSSSLLKIKITNIDKKQGSVYVALFTDEKEFLKKPLISKRSAAVSNEITFSFPVEEGRYSISVFQDTNNNEILDKNWAGIPNEPIGFGNNHKPFGKPEFSDCAIHYHFASPVEVIKLYTIF
jgi:uncharacterized protein (DUF2141 family)